MSSISTWVLSIAGIICISVLLELVMPEGQMNKYIKNIFSFVIILVIVLPLPKLMNKNIDLSSMFQYQEIQLQEDFLEEINGSKLSSLQKTIEKDASLNAEASAQQNNQEKNTTLESLPFIKITAENRRENYLVLSLQHC